MKFRFTPLRVFLFLCLVGIFASLGGFSFPDVEFHHREISGAAADSWIHMIFIFVAGATAVTLIDHDFCDFPPVSLRPFYVVLGLIAMAVAIVWLFHVRDLWERTLS